MKKAMVLLMLAATACSSVTKPKFKIGECLTIKSEKENWESHEVNVVKVVEIGKAHYHLAWQSPDYMKGNMSTESFFMADLVYNKIVCPK